MAINRVDDFVFSRSSLIAGTVAPEPVPENNAATEALDTARQWLEDFQTNDPQAYARLKLTTTDLAFLQYDAESDQVVLPQHVGVTGADWAKFLKHVYDHLNDDLGFEGFRFEGP